MAGKQKDEDLELDEDLDEKDEPDEQDEDEQDEKETKSTKAKIVKAAAKPQKEKKHRVRKYLRDMRGEFKKIIWPTMPLVVRNTLVTLAMCAVVGLFVGLIDWGLGALVNWFISLA